MKLKPYPAYKDSGVPWLGKIPEHWKLKPALYGFRQKQRKNTGVAETTVLSLSYGRIIVKPAEKLHGLVPASFETYQIVDPGEIIIRPTDLQNDQNSLRVGMARDRGIITSAYICLGTISPFIPDYGHLLLYAYDLKKVFYGMGSGLRQNLDFADLKRMPILIPPREEQYKIVSFLAHVERCINRFIHAKRRLLELLNEQKQAIIHRAVTRGLDPDVRLKPSGIEWLGDVPEHWGASKVKNEFNCLNTRRIPLSSVERGKMTSHRYDYYGASGIIDKVDNYIFDDILLLIAEDGANLVLRNLPLAIIARGKFWVNNHAHILKPKRGNIEYFANVLECIDFRPWITGAAQPKLTKERLMAIVIPVPPVDEQDRVIVQIDIDTASLRLTIDRLRREIAFIVEYRTRLIADVVTGKLNVQDVELSALDETEGWSMGEDEDMADEMSEMEVGVDADE